MEVGAASQFAIVKLDNTVFWAGNDGVLYRLNGYTPERISTAPIEQAISRCDLSKCFAMVYADRGHKIVYFTFPDGNTWGYDVATQLWHRRASYGMQRWRVNTLANWKGAWYAGDYTNGALYTVEWGINTENGAPLVSERVSTVIQGDQNRFQLNAVELVLDCQQSRPSNKWAAGVKQTTAYQPTGDLSIDLRYSKDGGHNWSVWRQASAGLQGDFNARAVFRRLGFGRRIVLHVRVSEDRGRDLVTASVDTEAF